MVILGERSCEVAFLCRQTPRQIFSTSHTLHRNDENSSYEIPLRTRSREYKDPVRVIEKVHARLFHPSIQSSARFFILIRDQSSKSRHRRNPGALPAKEMRPRDVGFHQQFDTGKRKRIASLSVVSRAVNKAVYLKTIRWSRERISQDPLPFSRAISLLRRDGRRLSENRASAIFVNGNCGDKSK